MAGDEPATTPALPGKREGIMSGNTGDAPATIMAHGRMYVRHDLAGERVRELQAERDELQSLLNAYRQAVFEVRDRLSKLDGDRQS